MRISDWSSDVCSSDLACDDVGSEIVEVDADRGLVGRPVDLRIIGEFRRFEEGRAAAVERDVRVAGRCAIGDHRDGLRRGVRRPVGDLDVEHGGEATQALRADAERIDLRSEEHTSELQSLMRISYAVFCLKKKTEIN